MNGYRPTTESLTPDEVAGILKITKNTVYELIKRGELVGFRVGNMVRVQPKELEAYIERMKITATPSSTEQHVASGETEHRQFKIARTEQGYVLRLTGSHDFLVERITQYVNGVSPALLLQSTFLGSLEGLMMLHRGAADLAAIHLMDPVTKEYNIPFIERFFIREPITIVRLATRTQGFIVASGNPKEITSWTDLQRKDVRFVNRQRGSGTRFLLDAHLTEQGIFPSQINGYEREEWSHLATAACVARGSADVALGIESAARQLGLSFIPLATEVFDLVLRWTEENKKYLDRLIESIRSPQFIASLADLEGYDYTDLGNVIYEMS